MAGDHMPDRAYLDAQLAVVRRRIAAVEKRRRKHKTWAIVGGGIAASLAITGGAVMVIQATDAAKSGATCYSKAALPSQSIDVGDAPESGTVGSLPDMPERVRKAQEQCSLAWQFGAFEPGGVQDEKKYPVPDLFACVLADGRLGVFPADGKTDCAALELANP